MRKVSKGEKCWDGTGFFFFFKVYEESPIVFCTFSLYVTVPSLIVLCLPLRRSGGRPCVWVFALCVGRTDDECGVVLFIPVFPVRVWCAWFCTGDLLPSP